MSTDTVKRQFYLHLYNTCPGTNLRLLKARTHQCFDPTLINNIPRIDWLLLKIVSFRATKYDSRQWLLRQELALQRRRTQLVKAMKQAELF